MIPGEIRECIEAKLGRQRWDFLSIRQELATEQERAIIDDCFREHGEAGPMPANFGALDPDAPLPVGPIGQTIIATLGPITLETYSPATITTIEHSTNLYIHARNEGPSTVTIIGPRGENVDLGSLAQHFFEYEPNPVQIAPGQSHTFEFMLADNPDGGQITAQFPFTLEGTSQQASLPIEIISGYEVKGANPITATIAGKITDANGKPLDRIEVKVYAFNARGEWFGNTDGNGAYRINIPSSQDLEAALGDRPLPYSSLGYTVITAPEGYTAGYKDEIEVERGQTATADFQLEPVSQSQYAEIGEYTSDGVYGYWWALPLAGFTKIASVQARHPPELGLPGHVVMIDREGTPLWKQPIGNEAWGFNVSANGKIAVGSHDEYVYLFDENGNLEWKFNSEGMNRWVKFDSTGELLVTGPIQGSSAGCLDAATGSVLWTAQETEFKWLRNAVWSTDGERVLLGYGGGQIQMVTKNGQLLWQDSISEFPMVFEMDSEYNSYCAGKNRELFSFDANGDLRWRKRVGNHVVTAGANNISADGNLIVIGGVGGWIQAYDSTGDLLWQRRLPGTLQGHNALDMTPDGKYIIVGSAGEAGVGGYVNLYDRSGTLLWQTYSPDRRDEGQIDFAYEYDHNQRGAITVTISDDGRLIAAGYGDSTLRIFEQSPPD